MCVRGDSGRDTSRDSIRARWRGDQRTAGAQAERGARRGAENGGVVSTYRSGRSREGERAARAAPHRHEALGGRRWQGHIAPHCREAGTRRSGGRQQRQVPFGRGLRVARDGGQRGARNRVTGLCAPRSSRPLVSQCRERIVPRAHVVGEQLPLSLVEIVGKQRRQRSANGVATQHRASTERNAVSNFPFQTSSESGAARRLSEGSTTARTTSNKRLERTR